MAVALNSFLVVECDIKQTFAGLVILLCMVVKVKECLCFLLHVYMVTPVDLYVSDCGA